MSVDSIRTFALGFVPKYVGNGLVIFAYSLMAKLKKVPKELIEEHKSMNTNVLCNHPEFFTPGAFVENQAQWEKIHFGNDTAVKQSGCGALASYNAMVALGENPGVEKLVELIRSYELKGIAMGGKYGICPSAVKKFFMNGSYLIEDYRGKSKEKINQLGERYNVFIAVIYNCGNNIADGAHYICITKNSDGTYSSHNTYLYDSVNKRYCERAGSRSLSEAIEKANQTSPRAFWVMGIKNQIQKG